MVQLAIMLIIVGGMSTAALVCIGIDEKPKVALTWLPRASGTATGAFGALTLVATTDSTYAALIVGMIVGYAVHRTVQQMVFQRISRIPAGQMFVPHAWTRDNGPSDLV